MLPDNEARADSLHAISSAPRILIDSGSHGKCKAWMKVAGVIAIAGICDLGEDERTLLIGSEESIGASPQGIDEGSRVEDRPCQNSWSTLVAQYQAML